MNWQTGLLVAVSLALAIGVASGAVAAQDDDMPEPVTDEPLPDYDFVQKDGDTDEKITLGKQLYFEPRISETGTISCNTCHNVMEGGDDSRDVSMGVHGLTGPVAAPTVWNAAFHSSQFWDGRADSLEEQAEGPIVADVEMGMPDHEAALDRVRNNPGYVDQFEEVYGDQEGQDYDEAEDLVTLENTVDAIAAYERTLITPNSPYDQYVAAYYEDDWDHIDADIDAMTEDQLDGMETFEEIGCTDCHSGPAFNNNQHELPEGSFIGEPHPDYPENEQCQGWVDEWGLMEHDGRMDVTGDEINQYEYKVPTLRNIEHTAPYLHTGKADNLDDTIRTMAACQLDYDISDEEVDEINAFLTSLTGEYPDDQEATDMPRLPTPSGESMIPMEVLEEEDPDIVDDDPEPEPEPDVEDDEIPGFGIAVAAAALIMSTALIARRRD